MSHEHASALLNMLTVMAFQEVQQIYSLSEHQGLILSVGKNAPVNAISLWRQVQRWRKQGMIVILSHREALHFGG